MKLPTLFKRNKDGSIQHWTVEFQNGKHRVLSGKEGKKTVISDWTICEGKNIGRANETTPEQQAVAEAASKWTAKRDKEHYFEERENIDVSNFVQVMLAHKLEDRLDKIDFSVGVIIQTKFNGFRCIATKQGLFTRKGKKYVSVPHVENSLRDFFKKYPNAVLDGELFNYSLREKLNEISKLCRKTIHITPEDLTKSEQMVRYYVYDGWGFNDLSQSTPYHIRKNWIDENLCKYCEYYCRVNDTIVKSLDELNKVYNSFLDDKQEGAIIRIPTSGYENGRSNNLLKYKPQQDSEALILDIKEGDGNWSGAAKTASIKWEGKVFDATFLGEYEVLVGILKNKNKWIGKEITFKYFGLTGLGTPNSARIDPDNCYSGK